MNWKELNNVAQLQQLVAASATQSILLFKHSTRCSISRMALQRLEREWEEVGVDAYLLDLLNFRSVSNAIAEQCGVEHQSPQVLLLKNGVCIYHASHNAISFSDIKSNLDE